MPTAYEAWIDRWKGVLIFLVVLGHVVGGGYHLASATVQPSLKLIYKTIYFFHMPAFFLVAGYTFRDMQGKRYLLRKIRRLIVPYFAFGIASVVVYAFTADIANASFSAYATTGRYAGQSASVAVNWIRPLVSLLHGGGWPDGEGFRSNSVLWFLPCMFSTMMIFRLVFRLGGVALVVAAFSSLTLDWACVIPPGLPWGLSKVAGYLPYVILGNGLARVGWMHHDIRGKGRLGSAILLLSVVYFVVSAFSPDPTVMRDAWRGHLALYLFGFVGCLMSAGIAKVTGGRFLMALGASSLGIMLLHKFLVLGAELKLSAVRLLISRSTASAIAVSIGLSLVVSVLCLVLVIPIRKFMPWALGERSDELFRSDRTP